MTPPVPGPTLLALAAVALSCLVSGLALLRARRAQVCAGLLVTAGVLGVVGATLATSGTPGLAPPLLVAAGALVLPLALTAYPRWRWRHPVDVSTLTVITVVGAVTVSRSTDPTVVGTLGLVLGGVLLAHTWWRLECASDEDRRAVQWMALSVGSTAFLGGVLGFAWEGSLVSQLAPVLLVVVGPALYVGVVVPEVVDVRAAVVRTVVTFVTALTYTAVFVGLATLLTLATGAEPQIGALALLGAVASLMLRPVQVLLSGVVDQILFGARPDPLGAAHEVVGHIGDDPVLALRAIREGLVLPFACLRVAGVELVSSGSATAHTHRVHLSPGTELVVGLRPGDLRMPRSDRQVLDLAAPLLAQTLRARALAADLHVSREQTVAAIAEERRRLRRDLHDGLGPRLSGIAFTCDAARNLVPSDPDAAQVLLRTLRAETVTAIEDVRGLVYGMRPPALDELGLVGALRQRAVGLCTPEGARLEVTLSAPEDLSGLPAATEVAAYRIVVEALTNVGRHACSAAATVSLRLDGSALSISVLNEEATTTQAPALQPWRPGVGLTSMHERAAELGGTLTAGPWSGGGRVEVTLPV